MHRGPFDGRWLMFFVAVALASVPTQIQASCACSVNQQTIASGSYRFRLEGDLNLGSFMTSQFTAATSEWTSAFSNTNSAVTFSLSGNGNIPVKIDDTVCPDWASASGGQIRICSSLLAEDGNYIARTIRHEIGHFAGFSNSTSCGAADSVMKVIQPNEMTSTNATVSVGGADQCNVDQYYHREEYDECEFGCPPGYTESCQGDQQPDPENCNCCVNYTPVVVDMGSDALQFSSAEAGVLFPINDLGSILRVAWPLSPHTAFLALDRNSDGGINNGAELFGNTTRLRNGAPAPNGFAALAEFDADGNGRIDSTDWVYGQLRLWQDANRDGVSQPDELIPLADAGLISLEVLPRTSERQDRWGNRFTLRAKAQFSSAPNARFAYDVFPTAIKPNGGLVCQRALSDAIRAAPAPSK